MGPSPGKSRGGVDDGVSFGAVESASNTSSVTEESGSGHQ